MRRIKKIIAYNPDNGSFTWTKNINSRIREGINAGSLYKNGYIYITYQGKRYLAHRLAFYIMTNRKPKGVIDHKDRNRSNNKWDNLRDVTMQENMRNVGAIGVTYEKSRNKYKAQIFIDNKNIFLGRFNSFDEARKARVDAEIRLWK